jgi:hypothetical protein
MLSRFILCGDHDGQQIEGAHQQCPMLVSTFVMICRSGPARNKAAKRNMIA